MHSTYRIWCRAFGLDEAIETQEYPVVLCKRGALRGVRLISYDTLMG